MPEEETMAVVTVDVKEVLNADGKWTQATIAWHTDALRLIEPVRKKLQLADGEDNRLFDPTVFPSLTPQDRPMFLARFAMFRFGDSMTTEMIRDAIKHYRNQQWDASTIRAGLTLCQELGREPMPAGVMLGGAHHKQAFPYVLTSGRWTLISPQKDGLAWEAQTPFLAQKFVNFL